MYRTGQDLVYLRMGFRPLYKNPGHYRAKIIVSSVISLTVDILIFTEKPSDTNFEFPLSSIKPSLFIR